MTLKTILQSESWQLEQHTQILFCEERYFIFEVKRKLFIKKKKLIEFGHIEYDDKAQELYLNHGSKWELWSVDGYEVQTLIFNMLSCKYGDKKEKEQRLKPLGYKLSLPTSSSIQEAAWYGDLQAVKTFLDYGVDINDREVNHAREGRYSPGRTALIAASQPVSFEVVDYLLQEGADLYIKDDYGYLAMHRAITSNSIELVKRYVNKGMLDQCTQTDKAYFLDTFMMNETSNDIVKIICDLWIDEKVFFDYLEQQSVQYLNYLFPIDNRGCQKLEQMELVKYFYEIGIQLHEKTVGGNSAFLVAVSCGAVETVKLFIEKGADIHARTSEEKNEGETALDLATRMIDPDGIGLIEPLKELLIEAGCQRSKEPK